MTCLPQALSISGSFWSLTGLIREYGVDLTFLVSASMSASEALSLYVTQTAPCSSECTAFSFGISWV